MSADLKQLIYSSDACAPMDTAALQSILASSRMHNAEDAITGLLLYSNGRFLQVLEGASDALDVAYSRIANDPRHEHVRTVLCRRVVVRDFPDWSMACRVLSAEDVAAHPEFNDFFSSSFDERRFREFASPARFLLLAFRDIEGA